MRRSERSRLGVPAGDVSCSLPTLPARAECVSSVRGGPPAGSSRNMKKATQKRGKDELRPEYDLAKLKGGVRGKYYEQAAAGTNLVLLEPDVARAFPDSGSVNRALRLLQEVAARSAGKARKPSSKRTAAG